MKRQFLILALAFTLLLGVAGPASAAQPVPASGDFKVDIDLGSFSFTSIGANCLLHAEGEVEFSGTLEGQGSAVTTALVLAPCSEAAATPPGTFRDAFSSEIEFAGTVDGTPVTAGIHYHGTVEEGGQIRAVMNFSGDLRGTVQVDGEVAVGGSYSGKVVVL